MPPSAPIARALQTARLPEELGSLLDSLADAAILVDPRGRIFYFNDEAQKMTALSRTTVSGHAFEEVFEDNPWLTGLLRRTLESREAHTDRSAVLRYGPDLAGRCGDVPVTAAVTPWSDASGRDLGALVLLSDRSRMAELERDRLRSDRLASLGTIAAGLAHEIKNPLGGIKGAVQLLLREARDPQARELLEVISKESGRVNAILENLLRFGRPPAPATETVNLHETLDDVARLVSLSPAGQGRRFQAAYDPSLPAVRGSAGSIKQVFLNLVQNAAEASPPGGLVELSTRYATHVRLREAPGGELRGYCLVSVRDEGPGISPADLSRLFTPFFTTKEQGTGLGLVLSHQILKEHGGFISVESAPGKGTTFLVYLPKGA